MILTRLNNEMLSGTEAERLLYLGVPGMALIQSEINRPRVFTAKCSEPQADTIKVGVKEVV